ncbi:hypothetical protein [Aeromicrobium sp. UC242_57]|uniref:hypothetical protein n=1 Tax=Aeromicrobium sp. UC242_57 TaxID=3374624 RepID=UPI0037B6A612
MDRFQRRGRAHVLTSSALPVGASVHTELRARFERSSTNQTQRDAVALTFDVTLTDAGSREATRGQQRVDVLGSDRSGGPAVDVVAGCRLGRQRAGAGGWVSSWRGGCR